MKYLLIALVLASCGKSEIDVSGSEHKLSGGTQSKFVIEFKPFNQVAHWCNNLHIQADFASKDLYKQKVSECIFENLSIIDFGQLKDFNNQYCLEDDLYNELSDEDKLRADQLCEAL